MADNKGVWLDKDTGMVVTSRPARGRQLVPPGREPTNAEKATIDRFREGASAGTDASTSTVTTKSVTADKASK